MQRFSPELRRTEALDNVHIYPQDVCGYTIVNIPVYIYLLVNCCMSEILETIKKELLSWPDVTAEPHRFGSMEFRLNKREIGHIHVDRVVVCSLIPFL
jgi:hypothetical protein